jgi:hypothetical protein
LRIHGEFFLSPDFDQLEAMIEDLVAEGNELV